MGTQSALGCILLPVPSSSEAPCGLMLSSLAWEGLSTQWPAGRARFPSGLRLSFLQSRSGSRPDYHSGALLCSATLVGRGPLSLSPGKWPRSAAAPARASGTGLRGQRGRVAGPRAGGAAVTGRGWLTRRVRDLLALRAGRTRRRALRAGPGSRGARAGGFPAAHAAQASAAAPAHRSRGAP